jgi:subtilase family serine protease
MGIKPGYEQVFVELAAQGQSLFIASGDSGVNVGDVGYPDNRYVPRLSISLDIPSPIDLESPTCKLVGGHRLQ